uniref:Mastermind-like 2 n=1 Tax=Echinostoma caproni TaxID=27848 RepID=A0A183B0G1_9TREM
LEFRAQGLLEGTTGGGTVAGTSGTRWVELDAANNGAQPSDHPLLDDEIKAEIHARLRREMARPQYKKDLFYTGSVIQLSSNQLATDNAASVMGNTHNSQTNISVATATGNVASSFIPPAPCPPVQPQTHKTLIHLFSANSPASIFSGPNVPFPSIRH